MEKWQSGTIEEVSRQNRQNCLLQIDLSRPDPNLFKIIGEIPILSEIQAIGSGNTQFRATMNGGEAEASDILTKLLKQGCRFPGLPVSGRAWKIYSSTLNLRTLWERRQNEPVNYPGIRERLRTKNLIASGLFSRSFASPFTSPLLDGMQVYIPANESDSGMSELISIPENGAREAFTILLILQGFYLMFLGTGRVASVTAEEKECGSLDYV